MSKTLFKRAAATGAAIIALGFGGAMSLSSAASAATTHPAAQNVQVSGAHNQWVSWCGHWQQPWCCFSHRYYHGYGEHRYGYRDARYGEGDRRYGEGDRRYGEGDRRYGEGDRRHGEGDCCHGGGRLLEH
jgi:hypothetical protein